MKRPPGGVRITEDQAIDLAERFIADMRKQCRCGRREFVEHLPVEFWRQFGLGRHSGYYSVTFKYDGPPTPSEFEGFCPPYDHKTVVHVDDRTGKGELLEWM